MTKGSVKVNRIIFFLVSFLLLTNNLILVNAELKNHMDTIILLDVSGSMLASDKTRIAIEATKLYIDMMETRGSRIGVIAFNDEITTEIPLTEINNQKDKDDLKNKIDMLEYDGHTDLGMSLKRGSSELLKYIDSSRSPALILFTDGKIEIDETKQDDRTHEDSLNDIYSVLNDAKDKFPIYTIGLNYNKTVDEDLLVTISRNTLARAYLTDKATDLPQIFNEIFADHIKSTLIDAGLYITDGEDYTVVNIDIPNSVVIEANIIMLSQSPITEVKLSDPNGTEKSIDDQDINLTVSDKYSMLKVINPIEGKWILKIKGIKNNSVQVNLIYNYDLGLKMIVDKTEDANGKVQGAIKLTGKLLTSYSGIEKELDDVKLYEPLTGEIVIEKQNGSKIIIPMKNATSAFSGEIDAHTVENFFNQDVKIYIRVSGNDYSRESEKIEIKAVTSTVQRDLDSDTEADSVSEPLISEDVTVQKNNNMYLMIFSMLTVLIVILVLIFIFLRKKNKLYLYQGKIEIRVLDDMEYYVAVENPTLSTFVGKITLEDFMMTGVTTHFVNSIEEYRNILSEITINQNMYKNEPALFVKNHSTCVLCLEGNNDFNQKEFYWQSGHKLIIKYAKDVNARIEMIYNA